MTKGIEDLLGAAGMRRVGVDLGRSGARPATIMADAMPGSAGTAARGRQRGDDGAAT
jgi:hypothetical protein